MMRTSSLWAKQKFRARSGAPPWVRMFHSAGTSSTCRREGSMSSRSRINSLAIVAIATVLGGCSDIYFDRRETIALSAGDAIATDAVTQMIDPWPPYSARRNFAFNGQRMQAAQERYRTGRVIPPVNVTTSSAAYQRA